MNSFKSRSILLLHTFFLLAGAYFSVSSLYPAHHLAIKEQPAHFHMVDGLPPAHQAAPPALPLCAPPKDFLLKDLEHELAELHTELISLIQEKKTASAIFKAAIKQYRAMLLDPALLNAISPLEKNVLSELAKANFSSLDLSSHNISGHTLLHKSIHSNHSLATQFLIPLYAQANLLNTLSEQGETPLMLAVKYNNFALAKLCLDAGAHINIPDASGKTPLQVAREKNFVPLVKFLTAAIQQQHALSSEIEGEPHPSLPPKENPYEQIEGIAPWDEKHTGEYLQNAQISFDATANTHEQGILADVKHQSPLNVEGEIDSEEEPGIPVDTKHVADVKETAEAALLSPLDAPMINDKDLSIQHTSQVTDDAVVKNMMLFMSMLRFSPLIAAAKNGDDVETIKSLIEDGADIAKTDDDGLTALHHAAYQGHSDIVRYLVPHFAKAKLLNAQTKNGTPVLPVAAARCDTDTVKTLLDAGADITQTETATGSTALHLAALYGKASTVRYLVPHFAKFHLLNAQTKHGDTALTQAAAKCDSNTVQILLDAHADITKTNKNCLTALHAAALNGNVSTVQYLLTRFARTNLIHAQTKNGATALMLASQCILEKASGDVVDALINAGSDITKTNNHGFNALHYAVHYGNSATLQRLLPLFVKANLLNAQSEDGKTAFQLAAEKGDPKTIKTFLDAGIDITKTDKNGLNVLHCAAYHGNNAVVQYLLPLFVQAKLLNARSEDGETVLQWAAGKCNTDCVKALINARADICVADKKCFLNALHVAVTQEKISTIEYLIKPFAEANLLNAQTINGETALILAADRDLDTVVKALVDAGADITKTDKDGLNALHHAARKGKIKTVQCLVPHFEKRDLLTAKTKRGSTALMEAAHSSKGSIIQHILLPHFAKAGQLNAQTTDDNTTAFMWTAANCDEATLKAFIHAGADITKTDKDGFTALHYAIANNNIATVKLLAPHLAHVKCNAGATPLLFASLRGNVDIVKTLLPFSIQAGLLNAVCGKFKHTALSAATLAGHEAIVKILKEAGAK